MKRLPCLILVILVTAMAFAQEENDFSGIRDTIDTLVSEKKTTEIDGFLQGLDTPEKKQFAEEYILEKARESVLNMDLEYARSLAETVLLFNLDNTSAQDLYASIEVAIREQAEMAEKQRLAEEEKKRQEEEAARQAEEKAVEEERIIQEQEYQKSVREIGMNNLSAFAALSPAAFLIYNSGFADLLSGEETIHSDYGLAVKGFVRFSHPYVNAALEAQYAYYFLNLTDGDLLSSFNATAVLSTPLIGFPLALRFGYAYSGFTGTDGGSPSSVLFTDYSSFSFGLGIDGLSLGSSIKLSAGADVLASCFSNDLLDFAMLLNLSARINLFGIGEKLVFVLYPNVDAGIMVSDSTLEWTIAPSISAGVTFNEK